MGHFLAPGVRGKRIIKKPWGYRLRMLASHKCVVGFLFGINKFQLLRGKPEARRQIKIQSVIEKNRQGRKVPDRSVWYRVEDGSGNTHDRPS
jgi:hypothetical protein